MVLPNIFATLKHDKSQCLLNSFLCENKQLSSILQPFFFFPETCLFSFFTPLRIDADLFLDGYTVVKPRQDSWALFGWPQGSGAPKMESDEISSQGLWPAPQGSVCPCWPLTLASPHQQPRPEPEWGRQHSRLWPFPWYALQLACTCLVPTSLHISWSQPQTWVEQLQALTLPRRATHSPEAWSEQGVESDLAFAEEAAF